MGAAVAEIGRLTSLHTSAETIMSDSVQCNKFAHTTSNLITAVALSCDVHAMMWTVLCF